MDKNLSFFKNILSLIFIIIVSQLLYAHSLNTQSAPLPEYHYINDLKVEFKNNVWFYKPNQKAHAFTVKDDKIIKKYTISIDSNGFRKTPDINNPKKPPVLIFGGSYIRGKGLKDTETLPWVLAELTDRKIYNISVGEVGPQNMLMYLKNPKFYKTIPKAKMIIYSFKPEKYNAINNKKLGSITMNEKGELIFNQPKLNGGYEKRGFDKTKKIFLAILKESHNLALAHYPNSRFIVLIYGNYLSAFTIKEINDLGIEVVSIEKLLNESFFQPKFQLPRDDSEIYPNAYVWEEVAPFLAYRLDL